jgi:hypothetical protein
MCFLTSTIINTKHQVCCGCSPIKSLHVNFIVYILLRGYVIKSHFWPFGLIIKRIIYKILGCIQYKISL